MNFADGITGQAQESLSEREESMTPGTADDEDGCSHEPARRVPLACDTIVKRDGTRVPFDPSRITAAILAAGRATGEFSEREARNLTIRVLNIVHQMYAHQSPTVEDVQDIVEDVLLMSPYKKTAKAYIIYREQHSRMRELVAQADIALVDNYLEKLDWKVKENSNMSFSLQGLNNYISASISERYWLNKIYPAGIREAHVDGDLHIHDLNQLSVYCVGWDLKDLLTKGFRGAYGKVESAPPRHFRSALGQIVNFFYTLQGEAAGAQAFSNFDTLLAPFVEADGLTYEETKQCIQEFVFNLNVPTRVGFQTPFTNITFDLRVPSHMREEPAVVGGRPMDATYGEFESKMRWIVRAFFEIMLEGDAAGRIFTFPIPTLNITPDFPWDAPELEPMWKATGRYGIPYFANFVNSEMSPEDARSMCCRLRLDLRKLDKRGGGLFGSNPLTGSIGVVTLNMPRLAWRSLLEAEQGRAGVEDIFLERLDELMELARESLEIKRKLLEKLTDKGLYPYSRYYLRGVKQRHGRYWYNHFSTIGLVGMNEACRLLFGRSMADEHSIEFGVKVLEHMRERLALYQEQTGSFFNLEATPAEGTGYRLALIDAGRYPSLRERLWPDGETPCYTNSTQLPVDHDADVLEVIRLQEPLQSLYTGGTVLHVFTGEAQTDPHAAKNFVKRVFERHTLPYLTITPTFSVCPRHGYKAGEHRRCPLCGSECEVYSRVVGYYRPVSQWNEGKSDEFARRRMYDYASAMLP